MILWITSQIGKLAAVVAATDLELLQQLQGLVSSIRASKSDDKRLTIFTGTKTLHLRCVSRENRATWVEALQVASGDILPSEDAVVSTEKLRETLLQEGINETVVKDCEAIKLSEVSVLQNRLKVLTHKHIILLDALRQLETEKIELETTVVDETKEHESCCGQGRRFSDFYSVMSEVSASDSEADNESQDGADVESDEDDIAFFDTNDILSAEALRSASYRSKDAEGNGSIYEKDPFFSDRLQVPVRIPQYPYVRRRDNLPEPKEKEKPVDYGQSSKKTLAKTCLEFVSPYILMSHSLLCRNALRIWSTIPDRQSTCGENRSGPSAHVLFYDASNVGLIY